MLNINDVYKSKLNLLGSICVLLYSWFVCMSVYANVSFTTICECLLHNNMRMFTSNQYSYVRGPLRVCRSIRPGASGLPYYCNYICVRFGCTRHAGCVDSKPKKKKSGQVVTGHSHERPCSRSWHRRTSHDTGLRHVRYPCPGACTAYPHLCARALHLYARTLPLFARL